MVAAAAAAAAATLLDSIMRRAKHPNSVLLFIIVLCSSCQRFCRAQGNNNTSSNPCQTYGKCGPFGICSSQGSPICSCLQGFYPRIVQEWESGNWTNGCTRRVPLSCEGNNGTSDGFLKLNMMRISGQSDRWFGPDNQCEGRCLSNCSCLAYGFEGGNGCRFWRGTLIDLQKLTRNSGSDLYIRLSNSELDRKKGSKTLIVILVVVGSVIISVCTFFSWKWICKHRGEKKGTEFEEAGAFDRVDTSLQDELSRVNLQDVPLFKFETIAIATNNFSEASKLGKGGFGPVYKGKLANGREIAVKRLSQASGQGVQEFMNEVTLISKLQHRNLVRLHGCCVENRETMLIYEYMPNKSLDFFLFDPTQDILDWRRRFNIVEGVCRGLLYLHRDSRVKIIHRDLKPSNILLDNDWNPKISDFGMARIFGTRQDHVSTVRVVGTYGYMAPEYAMKGRFSEKSDVFSFGVLVLEIAAGRKNTSFNHQSGPLNLLGHVWKLWNEENVAAVIDPRISSASCRAEVVRCIHVGLLCVQELPRDRPCISDVLSMLSSEMVELSAPKRSAFTMKSGHSDAGASSQKSSSSSSLNYVTITMIDGR